MTFYVGQKVVCVDDNCEQSRAWGLNVPRNGIIYHVRLIQPLDYGCGLGLLLEEIRNDPAEFVDGYGEPGFQAHRFRPIVEKKTDISIFTALLTPNSKERVKA